MARKKSPRVRGGNIRDYLESTKGKATVGQARRTPKMYAGARPYPKRKQRKPTKAEIEESLRLGQKNEAADIKAAEARAKKDGLSVEGTDPKGEYYLSANERKRRKRSRSGAVEPGMTPLDFLGGGGALAGIGLGVGRGVLKTAARGSLKELAKKKAAKATTRSGAAKKSLQGRRGRRRTPEQKRADRRLDRAIDRRSKTKPASPQGRRTEVVVDRLAKKAGYKKPRPVTGRGPGVKPTRRTTPDKTVGEPRPTVRHRGKAGVVQPSKKLPPRERQAPRIRREAKSKAKREQDRLKYDARARASKEPKLLKAPKTSAQKKAIEARLKAAEGRKKKGSMMDRFVDWVTK